MAKWLEALLHALTFKAWAKQLWKDAPMRARQMLIVVALLLLLAFCSGTALGAEPRVVDLAETPSTSITVIRSTTSIGTVQTHAQCLERIRQDAAARLPGTYTYGCQPGRDRVVATVSNAAPAPVDCVVSAWSAWSYTTWVVSGNVETRTGTRTRTVTTQPVNGGTACPALIETTTESRPYTPPPPPPSGWVRAAGEGQSFMLYAPATVRYGADTRWVERSFPAGMVECGNHVFGDPAYNTVKSCEVQPASALDSGAPPPPPVTGTAVLTWLLPTQYTDGTPLPPAEIDAFRIYRGTSPTALQVVAEVDGDELTATALDLPVGTHYFAVTTVATNGQESGLSGVGSKTVQ